MLRRFGKGFRPAEMPGRNVARRVRPSPPRPCSAALFAALALLPAVAPTAPARAVDRTWTGGGDGQTWQSASNWSGGAVPGPTDRALIAGASVRLTGTAAAQALVLSDGAALDATGFVLTLGTRPSTVSPGPTATLGGFTQTLVVAC